MTDLDLAAIKRGIMEATDHEGPFEFGHYVERYDGPLEKGRIPQKTADEDWTPLIYTASSLEDAESSRDICASGPNSPFRHWRIVRRAVTPWEIVND